MYRCYQVLEGKRVIKKQLLLSFDTNSKDYVTFTSFTQSCTEHRFQLLPFESEATPLENHL